MVTHLGVSLPEKPLNPKNFGKALKGLQIKSQKYDLFVQNEKIKNVSLLSSPILIIYPPEGTKFFHSLISTCIKEVGCSDVWRFLARHCKNGIPQIQDIDCYQSYIPVENSESVRINIAIAAMHRLSDRIFGVSNVFQNKTVTIHERFCVSPP